MEKRILDVVSIGNANALRAKESFAFPSCMASLMQYLGENYPLRKIELDNKTVINRTGNLHFMAATGMAFGLLWSRDYSFRCLELTLVNPHDLTIKYAFDWAGYDYTIIDSNSDYLFIKNEIIEAINQNIPVLAFGIVGPPERSLITGYDNLGEILIGWSHFQNTEKLPTEPNGMFRKANWQEGLWKIVITKKRTQRKTRLVDLLRRAIAIMETSESEDFLFGFSAYDEWLNFILNPEMAELDGTTLRERVELHNSLANILAEARLKASEFLDLINETIENPFLSEASQYFRELSALSIQINDSFP